MVAGSSAFALWRRSFLKTAIAAVGTVIAVTERLQYHNGRRQRWYYPTVRFQTANGQTIDHSSHVGARSRYVQGQQVPLNYNPQNPYSVSLGARDSFMPWLPMIIVGGIGTIFLLVGFGLSVAAIVGG